MLEHAIISLGCVDSYEFLCQTQLVLAYMIIAL